MIQLMIITSNQLIAPNIYRLEVKGKLVDAMQQPGQFVNIRVSEGQELLLRRPLSICEINHEKQTFSMIYRVNGQGTERLSKYKKGQLLDVIGPLGTGYDITSLKKGQTALLVGGGIGIPPLYELAKQFNNQDIKTIHILGFQSSQDIFYEQNFKQLGETYIATADGSYGFHGNVIDLLAQLNVHFDKYYSCGPLPMLKALKNYYVTEEGYLSLESRMACGIGACYACVIDTVSHDYARICTEGPVFNANEVIL